MADLRAAIDADGVNRMSPTTTEAVLGSPVAMFDGLQTLFGDRMVVSRAIREQHSRGEGRPLSALPDIEPKQHKNIFFEDVILATIVHK